MTTIVDSPIQIAQYAIFSVLALVTLIGALKVASSRSIIHAAFWLFPVFAGIAGFYLLLDAQFLSIVQVMLYIGAILVLIIFAVTLTRNAADTDEAQTNRLRAPAVLCALILLGAIVGAMLTTRWATPLSATDFDAVMLVPGTAVTEVRALGAVLLQQYLVPFEIASVLLLAAMIGAIVMARKERKSVGASSAGTADSLDELELPAEETVQV
ncbi:MAG: NADH-quinone oxidoreductase subunit J family protein [Armatimonadota bacterium]